MIQEEKHLPGNIDLHKKIDADLVKLWMAHALAEGYFASLKMDYPGKTHPVKYHGVSFTLEERLFNNVDLIFTSKSDESFTAELANELKAVLENHIAIYYDGTRWVPPAVSVQVTAGQILFTVERKDSVLMSLKKEPVNISITGDPIN